MDTKQLIIPLVTTVVAFIAMWAVFGGGPAGTPGANGVNGKDGTFGALAGPDIPSEYLRWGGAASYRRQAELTNATAATNTPCILTSPAATSTLRFAMLRVSTGSTTATKWHLSKGTGTSEATTTANQLGAYSLSSGIVGVFPYSAAISSTVDGVDVFPPNSKLVWTIAGTIIADTSKFNGVCSAEWDAI